VTVAPETKFDPEIVRTVEPVFAGKEGRTLLTAGAVLTVKHPVQVAVPWSVLVRVIFRAPVVADPDTLSTTVIVVEFVTEIVPTLTPVPEITTPTPETKPLPARVTV
jgi:hypothetical protein